MPKVSQTFGQLLTQAVYRMRSLNGKSIQIIQDELGFALGRETGGSAIEYWRKGNVPEKMADVEQLARVIIARSDLGHEWLEKFLHSAGFPQPALLYAEILPPAPAEPKPAPQRVAVSLQGSNDPFLRDLAPYVVGPPITHCRQFFGRDSELRRIFSSISRFPLQNTAIIGPQRSGKTSLLHYLKNITLTPPQQLRPRQHTGWLTEPERYRWVFVDFQDIRMSSQEWLLRYILAELEMPIPAPCNLISFMETVSRRLSFPAVILMDEIGAALESPELDMRFWWSLRSLGTNQTGGRLGFILTSPAPPDQQAQALGKPSPFFNIFQRLNLGPLSEQAARELIAGSPHAIADGDVEWILAQSHNWPALVQILCQTYLSSLHQGRVEPAWRDEGLRHIEPYRYLVEGGARINAWQ